MHIQLMIPGFHESAFPLLFYLKLHNFTQFKSTPIRPQWSTTHFTLLNTIMTNVLLVRVRRGHIYGHLWKLRKRFNGLIRFRPFWCRKKYWSPFPNLTAHPLFLLFFFINLYVWGFVFACQNVSEGWNPPPDENHGSAPNIAEICITI